MRPQRDDEIVDPVRGVIRGQDYRFVLPLVVSGVAITTMLTNLRQLQTTERFLLFQEVAQGRTYAYVWRDWRKSLYDAAESVILDVENLLRNC